MKLYLSPTTPFGRKITVLLREADLLDKVGVEWVAGTPLEPGNLPLAHNPLGKIPVLVLGDGTAVYDSRVISRFLDDHFGLGVYPKGAGLWPALAREAAIDGMIEAAVLVAYEMRLRPENLRFDGWMAAQWAKVSRVLDMFESAPPAPTPMGQVMAMDHIALACALAYLDFRHDSRGWRAGRPMLAAWQQGVQNRPSLRDTQPPV